MPQGFSKGLNRNRRKSKSTRKSPDSLQELLKLAFAAQQNQRLPQALELCEAILSKQFNCADAWYLIGVIKRQQNKIDEAIAAFKKLLRLQPKNVAVLSNLGVLYVQQQQPQTAIKYFTQAIKINPNYVQAYTNLGQLYQDTGQSKKAIGYLQKAIELDHNCVTAYYNLGNVYKHLEKLPRAIASYQRAIELQPNHSDAHNNLGNIYLKLGKLDLAYQCYQKPALLNSQNNIVREDNWLLAMHYSNKFSPQEIYRQHQNWGNKYESRLNNKDRTYQNIFDPQRQLKIGYVSGDFKTHSVSYFLEPLLANHERTGFNVTCYANNKYSDRVTDRLRSLVDSWRDIAHLDDAAVVELIRADSIDILVDLAGHTFGNRLFVFARKPAPLQVTYLGYPDTTGLSSIDYRLSDRLADPEKEMATESILRLPGCFLCYQPSVDAPDVNALPCQTNNYITFGSFNNLAKVSTETIRLWGMILQQVPNSRILIKAKYLDNSLASDRLYKLFARSRIDRDRLDLRGWSKNTQEHLQLYHEVDLALDTYPYHGTTTTCEAMWMGVPVITFAGKTHVSRVGVSLLSSVGLEELVGGSEAEYVSKAVSLANDRSKLSQLRQNLRSQMAKSSLTNGKAIASSIEAAYRQMWLRYCQDSSN